MTNNNIINAISNATEEQKAALAATGLDINALLAALKPKAKSMGKLEGKLNDAGEYECDICGSIVNYNELDEEAQAKARKFGVCPHCQAIYDKMSASKTATVRVKNAISNGELCRQAILPHLDEIDEEKLALLTNKDFCQKEMKLAYALFLIIPDDADKKKKDEMRKPDGKNARWASTEYKVLGKRVLLTNDLYARNVAPIEAAMKKMFGAVDISK